MGFPAFQIGVTHSLETSLADEAVRTLLVSLLTEHVFLAAGQVQRFFRSKVPEKTEPSCLEAGNIKRILEPLVDAGLLGREDALLPPPTIGCTPLWVQDRNEHNRPSTRQVIEAAHARVPPLNQHSKRNLYFAKESARVALRAISLDVPDMRSDWELHLPGSGYPPSTEANFAIERHREAIGLNGTPIEIARTRLTALFNLNELRFMERFRPTTEGGANILNVGRFHDRWSFPDGTLRGEEFPGLGIFFLPPISLDQFAGQVGRFQSLPLSHGLRQCWWL